MTREEFAKLYVASLSNEECRELLTISLMCSLPDSFIEAKKATVLGWKSMAKRLNPFFSEEENQQ